MHHYQFFKVNNKNITPIRSHKIRKNMRALNLPLSVAPAPECIQPHLPLLFAIAIRYRNSWILAWIIILRTVAVVISFVRVSEFWFLVIRTQVLQIQLEGRGSFKQKRQSYLSTPSYVSVRLIFGNLLTFARRDHCRSTFHWDWELRKVANSTSNIFLDSAANPPKILPDGASMPPKIPPKRAKFK